MKEYKKILNDFIKYPEQQTIQRASEVIENLIGELEHTKDLLEEHRERIDELEKELEEIKGEV